MALMIVAAVFSVVVLFAVQNSAPATVAFLFWKFEASLSIVILLSVLAGAAIAALFFLSGRVRGSMKKKKENQHLPPVGR